MANMLMILAPGIIHAYDPVAIVQAPGIQLFGIIERKPA
jgi:hypothetical protein